MKDLPQSERYPDLREGMRAACAPFDGAYWRRIDEERAYPEEFVQALTLGGWLSAMIPKKYGGSGLGLAEASVIMEEINRSGGNAGACHGQMYNMGTLLRHGSEEQRQRWLPRVATGELRLQAAAITEPEAGSDLTRTTTTAVKVKARGGDRYLVNGRKAWISRVRHTDGMVLLARTAPREDVARPTDGLSLFMVQVQSAMGQGMVVTPVSNMANHETSHLAFDNLELTADLLIGEEGQGFHYIMDALNAERTLVAAECIGDAYWFIDKARRYAHDRVVFGRPIGQNQGIQFPLAQAYMEAEAANLMRWHACDLFDAQRPCATEANMAKYLAAKVSWEAADTCLQTHGGDGFDVAYDVQRKLRETRLYQVAPISTNLVCSYIAQHVLGLPRSF